MAQPDPLDDVAERTAAVLQGLGAGEGPPEEAFSERLSALMDTDLLGRDWSRTTEPLGAAEARRILRVTPYPATRGRPALSAVDFVVLHEAGLVCGYLIWEPGEAGPAIRRFQFGTAGEAVLLGEEPARSEALRGLGCTVLPDDMPGGPLR